MSRQQRIELYNLVGKYIFKGLSSLFSMVMISLLAGVDVFTGIVCAILFSYFCYQLWMTFIVGFDVLTIVEEETGTDIVKMSGRKWKRTASGGLRSASPVIGSRQQASPSLSVPELEVL